MSKANLSFERFYSPSRSHQLAALKTLLALPVRQEQSNIIAYEVLLAKPSHRSIAPIRGADIRPRLIKAKVLCSFGFKFSYGMGGESS